VCVVCVLCDFYWRKSESEIVCVFWFVPPTLLTDRDNYIFRMMVNI
jgi:hypothetical protein